jgi:hypothetical protein
MRKPTKTYHKFNEERFNRAHQLYNAAVPVAMISELLNISTQSVGRALKVATWPEYQTYKAERLEAINMRRGLKALATVEVEQGLDEALATVDEQQVKINFSPDLRPATKQDIIDLQSFLAEHLRGRKVKWVE